MKKILVINGPNLNMLGVREPAIYGAQTYADLVALCERACAARGCACECFQSNHEGAIVDRIQAAYADGTDGIVLNPGAYTHTSVALLDALKAVGLPCVEVHISDLSTREAFRQISYVRAACFKTITGEGLHGYELAVEALCARE